MNEEAWPFLIGRARTADHRFVVIPDFMTAPEAATALRASVSGDPMEPGTAAVREIRLTPDEAITVVYRVSLAAAGAFGIPEVSGDGALADAHGRPILVTEGVVLRRDARSVMAAGLPQTALDTAHDLAAPAYRAFWSRERQFDRQVGRSFLIGSSGSPPVRLLLQPGQRMPASRAQDPPPPARRWPRATARTVTAAAIVAALVLAGLGLLTANLLKQGASPGHEPTATPTPVPHGAVRTMTDFCARLRERHPDAAYALTTAAYRERTSRHEFSSALLPSGKAGVQCGYRFAGSPGRTAVTAIATIGRPGGPVSWRVTLTGPSWLIAGITRDRTASSSPRPSSGPAPSRPAPASGSTTTPKPTATARKGRSARPAATGTSRR